ncbi:unnamed protein product [Toxocara canis]|uniref:Transposase n=1 Tax=Toxocara canis TaxID=6265 RepID=A0A183V347_TOXCA|nr:unnamed protein product [Toxocara canis]
MPAARKFPGGFALARLGDVGYTEVLQRLATRAVDKGRLRKSIANVLHSRGWKLPVAQECCKGFAIVWLEIAGCS